MAKHDLNFKNIILDYLRESLAFFAGIEARDLPKDAVLTPLNEERLRAWMGERGAIQDVVVKVEFPSGEREMLVFCIEHNTRDARDLLKRQAKYCIQASIDFKTDRIVPVAIFPEENRKVKKRFKFETEHGIYMDFRCITVKLKELDARKFVTSQNIVARMCMPFMKYDSASEFKIIRSAYEGLKANEPDDAKRRKYFGFLQQYTKLNEKEREFQEQEVKGSGFEEDYMTTYEHAIKTGKVEGIELILGLLRDGVLKSKDAIAWLERLVKEGNLPSEAAEKLIKQIRGKV